MDILTYFSFFLFFFYTKCSILFLCSLFLFYLLGGYCSFGRDLWSFGMAQLTRQIFVMHILLEGGVYTFEFRFGIFLCLMSFGD